MEVIIKDINKGNIFVEIFKKLKIFTDSFILTFNDEQLYLQGMDSSHIIVFELIINKEWFDEYNVNDTVSCGINTNILSKILSVKDENQYLKLYQENDNDKLNIDFLNQENNKNNYEKYFQLPLIDIDTETLGIPEQEYDVTFSIDYKDYKNIIDSFALFDYSTISFKFSDDNIILYSKGTETNMEVKIEQEVIEEYEIVEDTNFSNSFNMKFLQKMSQFNKVCKLIQIQQSKEYPLELKYLIDDNCSFKIFLAPSIDNDEDI
tara:strand:+ start:478 stop:1266 length:789 start_codon:yes stop_codon:yes gene_type:complete